MASSGLVPSQGDSPGSTELSRWFDHFVAAREDSGSVTWWSVFLQSWVYERHLRNIRQRSLLAPGHSSTQTPIKDYLLEHFRGQLTSSDIRQAISACRMLEEMGITNNFVRRAVWRGVRAKDRCSKFRARGWGSLAAIWTMAQAAESDEDLLVCTSAILATTFCLRISETASIKVQDLDPTAATISYFNRKTRTCWITRPATTYIVRLMGFARAAALRLGRKPFQPLVKGGAKVLQASLVRLLREGQYDHLRWHCWKRLGATLLIRHGATVRELHAWGRLRSVKYARRYVATWEDSPWNDEHLPRPTLVEGKVGQWQFIKGITRTARSLWPMSLAARRRLGGWRSDGSDMDHGAHVGTLGTIDPPHGSEGEAGAKRTRVEPTTLGLEPSAKKDGPGGPPAVGPIASPSKRITKKGRVSRGASRGGSHF